MVPTINHVEPAWAPRFVSCVLNYGCLVAATVLVGLLLLTQTPASATPFADAGEVESPETVGLLQEGQQVYSQVCSSCHQPGGSGLAGEFPPLLNNPVVDDTAYLEDVIENGRTGELEVDGETYDGAMPSFSTLSAREMEAVIAYMQAGFVVPEADASSAEAVSPTGTEEPSSTGRWALAASLVAIGIAAVVAAPRVLTKNDRLATPWLDAASKAAAIVVAVALLIVVIPDWVLTQGAVTRLSRFAQDLIGTAVWGGGLTLLLVGLWFAHRRMRV